MNNTSTSDNVTSGFVAFAIIGLCFLFGILLTSCESQSGKLDRAQTEKVVILDSQTMINPVSGIINTKYKIKRINYGVLDWIQLPGRPMYEKNDTIFHKFAQ